MKKNRTRREFLEALRKNPIVTAAAERANISRQTVYRWQKEDPDFARDMQEAMDEGDGLMNDMAESQHYKKIREGHYGSIKYHLQSRHPKFKVRKTERLSRKEKAEQEEKRKNEEFQKYLNTPQKRELDKESIRRLKDRGLLD
ncbi:MAG: hypothetical protein FGM57_02735 [Candidatus Taylorbacteria bacterium]|nr:hypothetical protein [Candidatus Taylorbacteria bacterium]